MQLLQNRRPTLRLRKHVMEQLVKLLSEKRCIILADLLSKTFLKIKKNFLGIHNLFKHFATLIPYYLGSMFALHILRY